MTSVFEQYYSRRDVVVRYIAAPGITGFAASLIPGQIDSTDRIRLEPNGVGTYDVPETDNSIQYGTVNWVNETTGDVLTWDGPSARYCHGFRVTSASIITSNPNLFSLSTNIYAKGKVAGIAPHNVISAAYSANGPGGQAVLRAICDSFFDEEVQVWQCLRSNSPKIATNWVKMGGIPYGDMTEQTGPRIVAGSTTASFQNYWKNKRVAFFNADGDKAVFIFPNLVARTPAPSELNDVHIKHTIVDIDCTQTSASFTTSDSGPGFVRSDSVSDGGIPAGGGPSTSISASSTISSQSIYDGNQIIAVDYDQNTRQEMRLSIHAENTFSETTDYIINTDAFGDATAFPQKRTAIRVNVGPGYALQIGDKGSVLVCPGENFEGAKGNFTFTGDLATVQTIVGVDHCESHTKNIVAESGAPNTSTSVGTRVGTEILYADLRTGFTHKELDDQVFSVDLSSQTGTRTRSDVIGDGLSLNQIVIDTAVSPSGDVILTPSLGPGTPAPQPSLSGTKVFEQRYIAFESLNSRTSGSGFVTPRYAFDPTYKNEVYAGSKRDGDEFAALTGQASVDSSGGGGLYASLHGQPTSGQAVRVLSPQIL